MLFMLFMVLNSSVCYLLDEIILFKVVGFVFFLVVMVVLNFLVMMMIWKDLFKEFKGMVNYFMLNLVVCDFFVGFLVELFFVFLFWFFGCVIIVFFVYVVMYFDFYVLFFMMLGLVVESFFVLLLLLWSVDY